MAESMTAALETNCRDYGIKFFDLASGEQGIVHVIGPEMGLTQPGMTIACGDSHTSTHGAFGAIAFGIGTSQVRDVLASQCLAMSPLKVRRIEVNGALAPGVYAKDVILAIIGRLGVNGGTGFAYEYAGEVIDRMSMDERMTICNMSIEGGARVGYVNPDETTFEFLRGRPFAPAGRRLRSRRGLVADHGLRRRSAVGRRRAHRRQRARADGDVGHQPRPVRGGRRAAAAAGRRARRPTARVWPRPSSSWGLPAGQPMAGTKSTWRSSDPAPTAGCRTCARPRRSSPGTRSPATCGRSWCPVRRRSPSAAESEGLDQVFRDAGFEWRGRRLLDVSGHEPGSARGSRGLRLLVEPQLQGPPGQPHGPDAADEPRHGGRGRRCRRSRRHPVVAGRRLAPTVYWTEQRTHSHV